MSALPGTDLPHLGEEEARAQVSTWARNTWMTVIKRTISSVRSTDNMQPCQIVGIMEHIAKLIWFTITCCYSFNYH